MRFSPLLLLVVYLLCTAICRAYDTPIPPKKTPPSLPAESNPETTRGQKTAVIVSSVCSGALGAVISSVFVQPQNLARQWVAVSAAGTVLLISAAIEGEWIGNVQQWVHSTTQKRQRNRRKVKEIVEYVISSDVEEKASSGSAEIETEDMGTLKPLKTMQAVDETPKTYDRITSSSKQTGQNSSSDVRSSSWSSSSAGVSSPDSSRKSHAVTVEDEPPTSAKGLGTKKRYTRNLLMFWKKKKAQDEDVDDKPSTPPWSHFASEDTSRNYEEDYGDDDIGEGLGL